MPNPNEATICTRCGEVIEGNAVAIGEQTFCSDECAEEYGYARCAQCGDWTYADHSEVVDGEVYCDSDCVRDAGYFECEDCGEWVYGDDAVVCGDEVFCSDDCAENYGWNRCGCCGEWVRDGDATYVDDEPWCGRCVERYASYCDECCEYHPEGEVHYDEDDDMYRCESCREERERDAGLHRYGWTPSLEFFGDGGLFLGVELETDGGSDRRSYVRRLAGIEGFGKHFWMTEDSSLSNGVEITGHPMTLGYHLSIMDMYEGIRDAAGEFGFVSHNGGRCGLHVHVNRSFFGKTRTAKDVGGYKMMRLLQRFQPQFTTFSRRDSDRWCRYRTGNDGYFEPKGTAVSVKTGTDKEPSLFSKANAMGYETSHAQALNFQHRDTFEFRIFRGTLKWSTYFASLGLVNGMCHVAKERGSEYVESVDWYTLANDIVKACDEPQAAEYLADYLREKELI